MNFGLVSVIIPTYNRVRLIEETLDSVLAQTYSNWECIIVDDGSSDNTLDILKRYVLLDARFKYFVRPISREKGANACRNYGFEHSKGDYLIFLDSDDLLEPTCLENRVNTVTKNKGEPNQVCIFSMGLYQQEKKTETVFNTDFNTEKDYLASFLKGKTPWTITCTFWPRHVFLDLEGFNETFKRLQDVEIHTRMLLKGYKIRRINNVDSWYRILDNLADYVNEKKLPLIIDAHIMYIYEVLQISKDNQNLIDFEDVKNNLRTYFIKILSKYVFGNNLIAYKQVKQLNRKLNFVWGRKYIAFLLLPYYYKFKMKPNYGFHKLRKYLFSK